METADARTLSSHAVAFEGALRRCANAYPDVLAVIREQIDCALAKGDAESLCEATLDAAEWLAVGGHVSEANALAQLGEDYGTATEKKEILVLANCRRAKAAIVSGELDRARPLLEDALRHYSRRHPPYYDAIVDTCVSLAACCKSPASSQDELKYLRRALRLAPRTNRRVQWAVLARTNLAGALRSRGNHSQADRLLRMATALTEECPADALTKAQLFLDLARSLLACGRLGKASRLAQRAASISNEAGLPQLEVKALEIQGEILAREGDTDGSLAKYNRGLDLARRLGLTKKVAVLLNRSGTVLIDACQYSEANRRLSESLELHRRLKDPVGVGSDLMQLGLIYTHVNHFDQAMNCFRMCHEIAQSIGDKRGMVAALTNGANIHSKETSDSASKRIAVEMLEKALALSRTLRDRECETSILISMGNAKHSLGEKRSAGLLYARGLRAATLAGNRHAVAIATLDLAMLDREMGRVANALRRYRQACALAHKARALADEAHAYHHIGLCYDILDDPQKALDSYLSQLRILRLARLGMSGSEDRRSFLMSRLQGYENAVRCCLRLADRKNDASYADVAFLLAEEARCHELREALGLSAESVFAVLPARGVEPSSAKGILHRLRKRAFGRTNGKQSILLQFFLGQEICVLFTLRREDEHVSAALLPWDVEDINAITYSPRANDPDVVADVFGSLSQRRWRVPRLFLRFSSVILAEIRRRARPGDLLLVVPHAHLNTIPWAAILGRESESGPWRFLIEDYPIVVVPTSQMIGLAKVQGIPRSALVVGNPSESGLPHAEKEACAVAALFGCVPLLGDDATKAEVMKGILAKDVVHFACHGQYVGRDMEKTSLYLAAGERLSLSEMAKEIDWRDRSLVALSACSTGARFTDRADDEPSMVSMLLAGGCNSVLASLWPVDDEATATIMLGFYTNWIKKQESKPEALRSAILGFIESERQRCNVSTEAEAPVFPPKLHPQFWASFQLWGDCE